MSIYELDGVQPQFDTENYWIAPNASVIGNVRLCNNASVWFGTVIRGDQNTTIVIGENSNVQDNSVVHTDHGIDCVIGKNVTIGHKAMVHGCKIGDNSLIGINAVVMNHVTIGNNCIIGANALIPEGKTIPDNSLVMGAPGKVVKEISDEQIKVLELSAAGYVANWKRFKAGLKEIS